MQDVEMIRKFLVESHKNLSCLDEELTSLENSPQDVALLARVFRVIETIREGCNFLAFGILDQLTREAESLLSQLRSAGEGVAPSLTHPISNADETKIDKTDLRRGNRWLGESVYRRDLGRMQ